MKFSDDLIRRGGGNPTFLKVLEILSRPSVQAAALDCVAKGKKPVIALSKLMLEEIGPEVANDDPLKQFAGRAMAEVMEGPFGCTRRTSGNRTIYGDAVFASGTAYTLPSTTEPTADVIGDLHAITAVLLSAMTNSQIEALKALLASEMATRKAGAADHQAAPDSTATQAA